MGDFFEEILEGVGFVPDVFVDICFGGSGGEVKDADAAVPEFEGDRAG